jgi:hypothetical protein
MDSVEKSQHIKDCIHTFTKPFVTVRYQNSGLGGIIEHFIEPSCSSDRSTGREPMPAQEEISLPVQFSAQSQADRSVKGPIDSDLLTNYSAEILRSDAAQRVS